MQIRLDETFSATAKLKVVGIGGGGGNAINRMIADGLSGVELIAVNTDAMALDHNRATTRVQIGKKLTGGLGAGANPDIGRAAMEEDRDTIRDLLAGADMVFITAGMGGGTGTGGAPVVAEISKELGILTVAIVTHPFIFEGMVRTKNAKRGISDLRKNVDTMIVVPNQKLLSIVEKDTSLINAFKTADDVLHQGIRGISDVFTKSGLIQVDFADVKTIMKGMGDALMGTGYSEGEPSGNRAVTALESAIHSPLLDDISISGARGLLINFTGGEDISMYEVSEATQLAYSKVGENSDTNIIFGAVIDPDMKGKIKVTVIATGFNDASVEMQKDERGSGALKAILPVRENKVEQVALDLSGPSRSAHRTPVEIAMKGDSAGMGMMASAADSRSAGSLVDVMTQPEKPSYRPMSQPMPGELTPKVSGLPYDSYEDMDVPTFLRKQMQ